MKYLFAGLLACCFSICTCAQDSIRIIIRDAVTHHPLAGATVTWKEQRRSTVADTAGTAVLASIVAGTQTISITCIGYQEKVLRLVFPLVARESIAIFLDPAEDDEEEEVVVTATRISRTIANLPTRIEVISGEELAEKGNMKPGDIRMLLNESTGIQTQQTSATSFNAGIRIQGLEGRYTQLLLDGIPLYSGFSGGLSILQVAPLDLQQVEVIKGSASTLYGAGAIAGIVNLVSKIPREKKEISFLANGTSAGGLDLSGFYSEKYGKTGLTVFGSRNSNKAFDPAGIGLTAIPRFERYTINPRLYLYGNRTSASIGVTYITEDRLGGSTAHIENGTTGFYEKNKTGRITTHAAISHRLTELTSIQFKNSYSRFHRLIQIPTYKFDAVQQSSFSELSWNRKEKDADWVIGLNFLTEDLAEKPKNNDPRRNYHNNSFGAFLQQAWTINEKAVLESGLRADYVTDFGFELLPRISLLYKISSHLSSRIGGGLGYKTPTIFTEDAERRQFRQILPIEINTTRNERSIGANWDINYRTQAGKVGISVNHLFFYTRLQQPLALVDAPGGYSRFQNSKGHIDTKGMETNIRLLYGDFKLFVGYTYTDANLHENGPKEWLPLTARHRLNNVLMYEKEEKLKLGLEAYYFSPQRLGDGTMGRSYWITGFMAEYFWRNFSVFINFENFTDTRQTRFDTIYTGSITDPVFRDIYAPVEGFVVNGGIKVRL